MSKKSATRRYLTATVLIMIGYIISIFGVSWAEDKLNLPMWAYYGLALIPAMCIIAWIGMFWRFMMEVDEYLRRIQIAGVVTALAFVMAFCSSWGLLEFFTNVPKFPVFYIMPLYCVFYGIATMIIARREGVKGICL